jgi:hypothetical protein
MHQAYSCHTYHITPSLINCLSRYYAYLQCNPFSGPTSKCDADGRARVSPEEQHLSGPLWHSHFFVEGVALSGVHGATSLLLEED